MESTTPATTDPSSEVAKTKKKKAIGLINHDMLKLVARGSAIIAEILRLKDYIPESYSNPAEEKANKDIIIDLTYFKTGKSDQFEDKIKASVELSTKDEDFRENNIEIIERFYSLLYSIYQYITDWKTFVNQINQGKYVQYTIANIVVNKELRHIFCESVFSAGVMLLLVDRLIPGPIREKLMVSYYRYKGQTTIPHFKEMAELFKVTGYQPSKIGPNCGKDEVRPSKYPVEYFARCGFDLGVINNIIGTLTDSDIYEQVLAFPLNDHRAHALSSQASMLLVSLFYIPEYLEKENTKMRSIVDKFFNDNWVVSFYMGYTIDISEYWKDFKAAKKAIDNTLSSDDLKHFREKYVDQMKKMNEAVKRYLSEGIMTEEFILTNIEELLNIMRQSNVVIRWMILQRTITNKKYKEIINSGVKSNDIINLLLDLSQFEYLLKSMFQNLVGNKQELWNADKNKCLQRLNELIAYFGGNNAFSKEVKQENLTKYFEEFVKKIGDLNYNNAVVAGRRIGKLQEDLDNVKGLYHIVENESAKQNIKIINDSLNHMLRIINVKKSYLISISKISDFSYAWINIQDYAEDMQNLLKKDSKNVLQLRATFLKLASILNFPLVRLFQIESEDIESVTNYYSGELVKFVKNILQIIPLSVFNILNNVIHIFQEGFQELPVKVPKNDLKNYTQAEKRYALAKATHQISQFTKGIYLMEKTLMGVIEVDPKTILEEGIRKELLHLLAKTFHENIDFSTSTKKKDFMPKLKDIISKINCIKRSFLYIQDYINIKGSKMWCEEMHRLFGYYVQIEANKFLNRKIRNNNDKFELQKYNIPVFPSLKYSPESPTFLGRLTRYVIYLTSSKKTTFYPANYAWFTDKEEIFGIRMLNLIKQAIGVEGFQGFGKLIGYINYQKILELGNKYNKIITDTSNSNALKLISKCFGSPFIIRYTEKETSKSLFNAIPNFSSKVSSQLASDIVDIGQIELLRRLQNYSLSENAEVDSYILTSQVKSMNEINLLILKNRINIKFNNDPAAMPESNQNLFTSNNYYNNLCSFFEDFGFVDTLHTFYSNLSQFQYLPLLLAVTAYNKIMGAYYLDKSQIKKNNPKDEFDLFYFSYGIYIILYQMGKNNIIMFIALLCQLLRSNLLNQYSLRDVKSIYEGNPEIQKSTAVLQMFLQELAGNCNIDLSFFEINFNEYLMFRNIAN